MRNRVFIIGSIIVILLIVRLVIKRTDKYSSERKWYVENLNYEFTAVIDSLAFFNDRGGGVILCKLTTGNINRFVEDSLNRHLVQYETLRLFLFRKDGRIAKISGVANKCKIGDSVYVNSKKDIFTIARNRDIILERKISDVIGESFF